MVRMPSTEAYSNDEQTVLLRLAANSIQYGLTHGRPFPVDRSSFSPHLQKQAACFVTLEINDQLRGCIGSLVAHRPLVEDVAENAFAAAFRDPRFNRLSAAEFNQLSVSISVLSDSEPMSFRSEEDLLSQLRPGIDGLILAEGFNRGTFLPSVWESLPDRISFLRHLKVKAGLPADSWSDRITVERYTTFSFHQPIRQILS